MQNEIIISADPGETRVALLEQSVFTELHIERERERSVVGNVVRGRVSRVLPGMQAAFVDIGLDKAAFLYVGDYFANTSFAADATAEEESGAQAQSPRRRRNGRGQPPRIETVLHEGEEIVVQIAKAPIGTKGARITSNISIPGRHLVLTPWSRRVGVSRRIGSERERRRLREIVSRLRPENLGFIIRTAGDGVREADLEADIRYLSSIWKKIQLRNAERPAPCVLHAEHDLPLRIVRDKAGPDTRRIVTNSENVHESLESFVEEFVADPKPEIELYRGPAPIFEHYELEAQIHANLDRKVWLKSGGSLIIDQSEALTAIDVNTGRFVGKRNLEETVFKTNLEAVKEVVHQLRFRNIGGLIIIDLIDMESADHRDKVYRALQEAIRADKARTNILKISELGLVEMTRKRTRQNLVQTLCEPCGYCEGRGYVLSDESVVYNVLREIRGDLPRFCGHQLAVTVSPRVAERLLGPNRRALRELCEELGREVEIRARPGIHQEQFEIEALDEGPPISLALSWLAGRGAKSDADEAATTAEDRDSNGSKKGAKRRRGRRGGATRRKPEATDEAAATEPGDVASEAPEVDNETDAEEAASPAPRPSEVALPEAGRARVHRDEPEPGSAAEEAEPAAEEVTSPSPHATPVSAPPAAARAGEGTAESASPALENAPAATPAAACDSPGVDPGAAVPGQTLDDTAESRILPRSEQD